MLFAAGVTTALEYNPHPQPQGVEDSPGERYGLETHSPCSALGVG